MYEVVLDLDIATNTEKNIKTVSEWCFDNNVLHCVDFALKGRMSARYHRATFTFKTKEDATACKLRWL